VRRPQRPALRTERRRGMVRTRPIRQRQPGPGRRRPGQVQHRVAGNEEPGQMRADMLRREPIEAGTGPRLQAEPLRTETLTQQGTNRRVRTSPTLGGQHTRFLAHPVQRQLTERQAHPVEELDHPLGTTAHRERGRGQPWRCARNALKDARSGAGPCSHTTGTPSISVRSMGQIVRTHLSPNHGHVGGLCDPAGDSRVRPVARTGRLRSPAGRNPSVGRHATHHRESSPTSLSRMLARPRGRPDRRLASVTFWLRECCLEHLPASRG
jgi:hypothetical protein